MRRSLLLLLAWFAVGIPGAEATVAVRLSTEELTHRSAIVAEGEVTSLETHVSADGRQIFTTAHVTVKDPWKGAPPAQVAIKVPGGEAGEIGQIVQGAPVFREGEEVVVFLDGQARAGAPYQVVGLAQGKFTVQVDPDRGKVAVQDLRGLELVDGATRERVQPLVAGPIPLDQLKREVLAAEGG